MTASTNRLNWPVYLLFMLAIALLVAAIYCFARAHHIGETEGIRLQAAQSQQIVVEQLLNSGLPPGGQAELVSLKGSFERLLLVANSEEVSRAWQNFLSQLPDTRNNSLSKQADSRPDFSKLTELCLLLMKQLQSLDAPVNQIESAGHLQQLAESVSTRFDNQEGGNSQPLRARGPWLVFEQILNRFEVMLGTGALTDEDSKRLVVETRSEFNQLDRHFRGTLAQLNLTDGDLSRSRLMEAHAVLGTTLANFNTAQTLALQKKNTWFKLGMLCSLFSVLMYVLLSLALWKHTRQLNRYDTEKSQREQASMLRLLDEITELADGNLNTKATVSEDHTGAIADSINYAVGELRRLVGAITNSADRVTLAVEETGATAHQLANASSVQAREIQRSTTYLKVMAETMDQVAKRSGEASLIAVKSVEQAVNGKKLVAQTMRSMEQNSVQMRQTAMLLKRLSQSSQQIGTVVETIDKVNNRTKLLALNSAIQSGGNSDKNSRFAAISDEVQGLSDVLSESAREIEVLVRVIQDDARAALVSVDHTGAGIDEAVQNASLTDKTLKEIEAVSRRLSVVVEHLNGKSSRQSEVVKQLSANMGVINEVTKQSSHGMRLSASALNDLKVMATELRDGVADFSLPPADKRWSQGTDIVDRPLLRKREVTTSPGKSNA